MSDLPRSRATAVQALIDDLECGSFAERHNLNTDTCQLFANELAALLLREGQEPDWIGKCPKCNRTVLNHGDLCSQCAGLREGQEPPAVDPLAEVWQMIEMGWSMESRAYFEQEAPKMGFKHPLSMAVHHMHKRCVRENPDFLRACLGEGPPAPHGHAGGAVQEGVPDHCENCRAEMPVTTVHLCHACLPSAPREHAEDAPATEPKPPCSMCGGPHPFDTVLPSEVWNAVIRAAGLPEYLCLACIVERFGAIDTSFNCELWGGPFSGLPLAIHFNSRRARHSQQLVAANTELRHRLSEAERACKGLKERPAASQAGTAPREANMEDESLHTGDDERLDIVTGLLSFLEELSIMDSPSGDQLSDDLGSALDGCRRLNALILDTIKSEQLAAHGAVPPQEQK